MAKSHFPSLPVAVVGFLLLAAFPLQAQIGQLPPAIDDTPMASRLTADSVRYEGGIIIAAGSAEKPAKFLSGLGEITARSVRLDSQNRTVQAEGNVIVTRTRQDRRRVMRSSHLSARYERAIVTDILRGEKFSYDFKTRQGRLDTASVHVSGFDLNVRELTINGDTYTARAVILRPGGQTAEEDKIYGVPPLNLRAKQLDLTLAKNTPPQLDGRGAALYFNSTRLLPVPRYAFEMGQRSLAPKQESVFSMAPSISFSSADRVLITTQLRYRLDNKLRGLNAVADLGLSARQTFRGGIGLELENNFGRFSLRGAVKDVVATQLAVNQFLVNRLPEATWQSRAIPLFKLPGFRQTGLRLDAGVGKFSERLVAGSPTIRSTRNTLGATFTTRMPDELGTVPGGVFLDLFARRMRYPSLALRHDQVGYEIGYDGRLARKIRGVVSYRHTSLNGATPFLFDEVEIPREMRATMDYQLTPRFLVPIELRYDLDAKKMRDKSIGLLRAYKSFAYGATYDTARKSLKMEFRSGY